MFDHPEMKASASAIGQLEAELADVCGHLNALEARLVELTAEAIRIDAWAGWGIHSPSHWLAWKAGLSRAHAKAVVLAASRHDELPATMAAFGRGELSLDQVAPIVAKAPTWADAEVCELARYATVSQLRSVMASYVFEPPVPPAEDHSPDVPTPHAPHVSLAPQDDGRWRLSGLLDVDEALLLEAALNEARDASYRTTGHPASMLDGLVEMAHRSLDTVTDPARRDRYRVHVHLDADGVTDGRSRALPEWLVGLVGCDPRVVATLYRGRHPIATSDPASAVPAAVRRHVLRRDRCCRVPGCASRIVEVHHVVHREDGGDHDVANLAALCPRHHRLHHKGGLGVSGDAEVPGGLRFTDQHGWPLPPGPVARPPTAPPPRPSGRYRHPLGERLDRGMVTFNRPRTASP